MVTAQSRSMEIHSLQVLILWPFLAYGIIFNMHIYINIFTGPTGEIVALANDKDEEVLVAEFDLDYIKTQRYGWGVFRDRRPDLYKVLLTLDGAE